MTTAEQDQAILAVWRVTRTLRATAARTGVSPETVRTVLHRYGEDTSRAAHGRPVDGVEPTGTCAVCGKPLFPPRRSTCSPECAKAHHRTNRKPEDPERRRLLRARRVMRNPGQYRRSEVILAARLLDVPPPDDTGGNDGWGKGELTAKILTVLSETAGSVTARQIADLIPGAAMTQIAVWLNRNHPAVVKRSGRRPYRYQLKRATTKTK